MIGSREASVPFDPLGPWPLFLSFSISISVISFAPIPGPFKSLVGFLGILGPFAIAFWKGLRERTALSFPPWGTGEDRVPSWACTLFIALLLAARCYRMTSLPFWPIGDEATDGLLAQDLSRDWKWNILFGEERALPVFFWLGALFFKVFPPSLFSLRLFPALVSLATVLLAYRTLAVFWNKRAAFLFAWVWAFCFWEWTLSRFYMVVILGPLFQLGVFYLLGRLGRSKGTGRETRWALVLGLGAGLGFWVLPSWPVVPLMILLFLFLLFRAERALLIRVVGLFLVSMVLTALPVLGARLGPGAMAHYRGSFDLAAIPHSVYLYTQAFFVDGHAGFPFGSDWGGLFDPILFGLFLLGLLKGHRAFPWSYWWTGVACLVLGLLPGILSNGLELFRIDHAVPWVLLSVVLGIGALEEGLNTFRKRVGIFLLLALSFGLDAYNYTAHYSDPALAPPGQQWRSPKYSTAYRILRDYGNERAPVLLFSEFSMDYDNKTLNLACYPMDGLQNPGLAGRPVQWIALILKLDFAPYLTGRFPGTRVFSLPPDTDPERLIPFALFMVPADMFDAPTLALWRSADHVFREVNFKIKDKNPLAAWSVYSKVLMPQGSSFQGDPFLRTVFLEKYAFFYFISGDMGTAAATYEHILGQDLKTYHDQKNLELCRELMGRPRPQGIRPGNP